MRRFTPAILLLTAAAGLLLAVNHAGALGGDKDWSTIKGTVQWKGDKVPAPKRITVTMDKAHCLGDNPTAAKDGTILDESLLINPKNKGIKNVFVYLIPDDVTKLKIHPDLKNFPKSIELDQPACAFIPHCLVLREGQTLIVKNSAPVQHNIRWIGDQVNNQGGNVTIKPGDKAEIKDLKAQRLPLPLECNIHGWMKGRLLVVNHPYYAVTDENGNFEIKNAPVGSYKIMIYHEYLGYQKGKTGEEINVVPGVTNLGVKTMSADDE